MTKETIGFVGAGLMGHGIAANILKGGYDLAVIAHRSRAQIEDLLGRGAVEAGDLAELGTRASMVFLCLPGSPQVEATVEGLLGGLKAGAVVVDCSTADPVSTQALAARLAARGIAMADAPLGGTPVQAEAGELSAMVGADAATFARIRPVVETWAATIRHVGGPGDGHRMKLLNNFLSLGYAAIYAEALALGAKVGLDPRRFDSVIRGSRMDCGFYRTFMGYIVEGNREAHKFTLSNALKDLKYLESMANAAGVANPLGNAAKNSFAMAHATGGDGPEDYVPHLVSFVGRQNGIPLEP
ncbi:MAG TPA: NAD(P)-dependent oxidoreductase [Amaricoccus sp.]|uniref:NAD(P)-dependent oxidoreductase n=1 Tax=Amaricoccus sp. TaxID=1872485 RepID=UPI002BFCAD35|nr:NAD(P)-dependent oxidoreductase [Amaricoccus sp.]HMQ92719.1 NAD(P)-dependent oxidoreductase [Amaricoccus sp.]HMR52538.1 NAD(P)-dependent oxidoreductase [Amaricoccus sp.]HMR60532.1 NAD(P)-dependent oxidoreductase [Amaricoccus sp.]HMT99459.1 NAD(P)-dependent oxidoreductase [Amaricoccus sp.]